MMLFPKAILPTNGSNSILRHLCRRSASTVLASSSSSATSSYQQQLSSHLPTQQHNNVQHPPQQRRLNSSTTSSSEDFDKVVKAAFPGAISNTSLVKKVTSIVSKKGFTPTNTLLATSLCCDELARVLEDDFVKIYGNNFNLGGLSGFPFAGNTGFGAMAAHIPDDGYCLLIHGPHVGICENGSIGKVERRGIALVDNCCGSAIAASNYLKGITHGGAEITTKLQKFSDFQQGAVQELILPFGKRLSDAEEGGEQNRMKELPYALYDSQELLVREIVRKGK
eukprot:CAMPEP_0172306688 /NCGR_PEP_ID=MMETSP1058-20130122/7707_1 /TAXON_ID=83371 /ORGANISM="Detonula confervacea, Strain CCMP 353" /LENGTH=280 /DNA_ID=CAMNT_0013018655 /DNA_START=20 /DNA_END=859 /DNA_ORIENTATION=-